MSEHLATVTQIHAHAAERKALLARRARRGRVWALARFGLDATGLLAAVAIGGAAGKNALGPAGAIAATVLTLAVFAGCGLYANRVELNLIAELRKVLGGSAVVLAAIAGVVLLDPARTGAGDAAVITWLVSGTVLSVSRLGVAVAQRHARRQPWGSARTLIVGAGKVGMLTAKRLLDDPNAGLKPIGFLDKEPMTDGHGAGQLPVLGASWDLEHVVAQHRVDQVVIAFSTAPHEVMVDLVRRCWALGVDVHVVPRLFEVEGQRVKVEHLGALPLVSLSTTNPRGWTFAVKYAIDRLVAAIALLAVSPMLLAIALSVLVSTGRPILFRQKRVGRDGVVFDILKFRTMRGRPEQDGDGNAAWAERMLAGGELMVPPAHGDNRRTRVGSFLRRCSLDELPQLWNVVRGEMSLVGPRPEVPHFAAQFESAIERYPDRHRVKSGLTGWAQINGLRGDTSLADRVEWDNFYIENWSLWLDLKIVLLTLPALLGFGGEQPLVPPVAPLSEELAEPAASSSPSPSPSPSASRIDAEPTVARR
jgi:exopolysaccharide biosynthesis polyprenyl glycosylphosphotransferase